jgi:UDP-xylose/UDP-N-acetylglucosamine transporter B4
MPFWKSKSLVHQFDEADFRMVLDGPDSAADATPSVAKPMNGSPREGRNDGLPHRKLYKYGPREPGRRRDLVEGESARAKAIAVAYTCLPTRLPAVSILFLIFGGCCANVFALEAIIVTAPGSGTLVTATQFLLTSLFTLSSRLDLSRGLRHLYLRPRAIPLRWWLVYTAFFLAINILNNAAFGYKISVALHIILRSAGPVATMAVGYLSGKHYTKLQVVAVLLLFVGVVQAAIADARAKGAQIQLLASPGPGLSTSEFWTGFGILFLALVLSATMGAFTDNMHAKYGRGHTQENLFYSHTLSLPFFLTRIPELRFQAQALLRDPLPLTAYVAAEPLRYARLLWFHVLMTKVPVQLAYLLLNACTQYFCIKGVAQLSARSSSLTVGIVLNVRKLVSLLLSIWFFGNKLAPGVLMGAAIVFVGGGLYAVPSSKPGVAQSKEEPKKEL